MTTICPGVTERSTSWPIAFSRTELTKSRTTGKRDIGFEQRDADLAHRARDIVLAQRAVPAQPVEDIVQAIAEGVEHG